jgi:hypothetical protein
MRVLFFVVVGALVARVGAQNGDGVKTGCTQTSQCGLGCVNTNANGTCYRCGAGWYKDMTGPFVCSACPANSGSLCQLCSVLTDCKCNFGYTGLNGLLCFACAAGTYKSISGAGSCTGCGTGKYSLTVGATTSTTCLYCVGGSHSTITGSTSCMCNKGYTGPTGGTCTECTAGKYKSSVGSEICTDCDAGKYSTLIASQTPSYCYTCETNSQGLSGIGSSTAEDCICNAGFTWYPSFMRCFACDSDKYKDTVGNQACTACPQYSYASQNEVVGTTACACHLGYTGSGNGTCTSCAAGKYKPTTGSEMCTDCPAGKYNDYTGASRDSACRVCGVNSQGLSGIGSSTAEDCICKAGFTWYPSYMLCFECAGGKYKDVVGNQACTNCPRSSYSTTGSESCEACPTDGVCLYSLCDSSEQCGCKAGFYRLMDSAQLLCAPCPTGTTCTKGGCGAADYCWPGVTPCDAGYTRPDGDGGPCMPCAAGTFKVADDLGACTPCPANSTSPSGSTTVDACTCNAGYTGGLMDACAACPAGTYKNVTGSGLCTKCSAGAYSASGRESCTRCSSNSVALSDGSAFCVCAAGYGAVADVM